MDIQQHMRDSFEHGTALAIIGGNSKSFLGPATSATESISTSTLQGIVSYHPEELFITAQAGTRLSEIEQVLTEKGQQLPFEPPSFSNQATIGGAIASGLSGPGRPWSGAARDFVLGTRLINGKGEWLHFGGEVIKNVAGYDVSRLMCGAFGTLGLLTEISIKVIPLPTSVITLNWSMSKAEALQKIIFIAQRPYPISAASWFDEQLLIRFSGATAATHSAHQQLGGEQTDNDYWNQLNHQQLSFFQRSTPLWRLSLPTATEALALPGDELIDWGGAQRWLSSDADASTLRQITEAVGGHATLFRCADQQADRFTSLPPALLALHRRLKQAFDPKNILNPGRLYQDL